MSYLGKVALKASDIRRLDVTSSTSATHTLTWTPPNEQSLIITINGVKQQNNYSISGVTLTLDTALVATDEMEVIGINDIGTTTVPGDGTVTATKLQTTGTASSSTYLSGTMAWSTVEGAEITSQNKFFKNWNTVTGNQTTTVASTENAAIIGPITVNSGVTWTIVGTLQFL